MVLGVVPLGLIALNRQLPAWQSLVILATMFAGTALYRARSGRLGGPRAFALAGVCRWRPSARGSGTARASPGPG